MPWFDPFDEDNCHYVAETVRGRTLMARKIASNPVRAIRKPPARRSRVVRPPTPEVVEALRGRLSQRDATLVSVLARLRHRPRALQGHAPPAYARGAVVSGRGTYGRYWADAMTGCHASGHGCARRPLRARRVSGERVPAERSAGGRTLA